MRLPGWKLLVPIFLVVVAGYATGFGAHDRSDFDRVIEVGPGGGVDVDIELGGGISFHHGSLHVTSHDASEVRIVAESSGWGKYAIGMDVEQQGNDVRLVGRVDGPLHWMFGGPAVDVRLLVPRGSRVNVRMDGGPLVVEDLSGPLRAEVRDGEAELRRADGPVSVRVEEGSVELEDIDGKLEIEVESGDVHLSGLRGSLYLKAAEDGHVDVESVIGPVRIESDHHRIELEDVTGDVVLQTEHGRIEAEDVDGRVRARTGHGGIRLQEIDGEVRAASRRGTIQVDFFGVPRGEIETRNGRIEIRVSPTASFDVDARTGRGRIRLDGLGAEQQSLPLSTARPQVPVGPGSEAELAASATPARESEDATDEDWARDEDWPDDGDDAWDDAWDDDWDGDWDGNWDDDDWNEDGRGHHSASTVVRAINGGGPRLKLRAGRGSIRIRD